MADDTNRDGGGGEERRGLIAWFARNHVAANLLFTFFIFAGLASIMATKLDLFPEIDTGLVTIQVPFPGGTPDEVEQGVVRRVEEAIADVEGVDEIRGTAAEGVGIVTAEVEDWADEAKVREDIKNAVDRITAFPADAEEPVVSDQLERMQVMNVALHGDVSRRALKELADRVKDDLVKSGAVSLIEVDGVPPYEISIEVDEPALRGYGLTFEDVAAAVRRGSLDLPAGAIETGEAEVLVRTVNQAKTGEAFAALPVRQLPDGTTIRVGDVADVIDGFEDTDYEVNFQGQPAVTLAVYRVGNEGALNVANTVRTYLGLEQESAGVRLGRAVLGVVGLDEVAFGRVDETIDPAKAGLPTGVRASIYNDFSVLLTGRIELMLKNAGLGLILVVVLLGLFLDPRLAFWAAAGLVMSFVASLAVLPLTDVSINMISLFAYILVLGIVVDDAIIVGENIYEHMERGDPPARAVVTGAREVAGPVTLTIMTTVVAFLPLLFASGQIGKILRVVPIVVIAVLVISLVEALLILPAHLSHARPPRKNRRQPFFVRVRERAQGLLRRFIQGPYRSALLVCARWRYATVSAAVMVLAVTIGWVGGGLLPWAFFPSVDADFIAASIEMPPGTPSSRTREVAQQVYEATLPIEDQLGWQGGDDQETPLIKFVQTSVGGRPFFGARNQRDPASGLGDPRLAEVVVQLVDPSERDIPTGEIRRLWRDNVGQIAGVRSLKFNDSLISAGDPVNVRLEMGTDNARDFARLQEAAATLKRELAKIEGVREIGDSFQQGKPQFTITGLTPTGRALGLSVQDVSRQVRAAFFGAEAQRVQRGRDEVRVYVRYPEARRSSLADIEDLFVRTPDGSAAPLSEVATYELGEGFTQIRRLDRRRVINVTADVDTTLANTADVATLLGEQVLPALEAGYPGLRYGFEGEQQEQAESMTSLAAAMAVAIVGIYILLAAQFRSYVQPMIVMSAIPFGFVGAVWGHVVLNMFKDMPLNFLSMFGVVALTGVVVNDSLVLIDLINRKRVEGATAWDAVIEAGVRRCRPIILTTLTTFFGLVPMILETELQAQFLIPMALSLGFGILLATFIILLLVPCLYLLVEDARTLLRPLVGDLVDYTHPDMKPDPQPKPAAATPARLAYDPAARN